MSNENQILESLEEIKTSLLSQKKVLSFEECKKLTGFSSSHLYKLTSANKIPFFKPLGKFIYFEREEIENWLLRNRAKTLDELEQEAVSYATSKKGGVAK